MQINNKLSKFNRISTQNGLKPLRGAINPKESTLLLKKLFEKTGSTFKNSRNNEDPSNLAFKAGKIR